jgi:hypothetical protein
VSRPWSECYFILLYSHTLTVAKKVDLVALLSHLGLQDVRAERLITLSFEYLKDPPKDYDPRPSRVSIPRKNTGQITPRKRDKRAEPSYPDTPVSHLPGSGRYALDSYRIFCTVHDDPLSTDWESVLPTDKELIRYLVRLISLYRFGSSWMSHGTEMEVGRSRAQTVVSVAGPRCLCYSRIPSKFEARASTTRYRKYCKEVAEEVTTKETVFRAPLLRFRLLVACLRLGAAPSQLPKQLG